MPATAALVQVNDGSPKAAARPSSSLWQTGPDPSVGQAHEQAPGALATTTAHIDVATASAHVNAGSPKAAATPASSSTHRPSADLGSPPSLAPKEVMTEVLTKQAGSLTSESSVPISTPISVLSRAVQLL